MGNSTEDDFNQLSVLATKIKDGDFTEKPTYTKITTHDALDEESKFILTKLSQITKYTLVSPLEILYKQKHEKLKEKDKCSICLCEFYEDEISQYEKDPDNIEYLISSEFNAVLLEKCFDHFFHIKCLNGLIGEKQSFRCPICSKIYGILTGDMPPGYFNAYITNQSCAGYDCNTIVIQYTFNNGPGYTGTSRRCYLPNNPEGREILALLKVAFDRRLTFVVGTSITTGRKNTVVWNGIHHKTQLFGGPTNFGYPDKNYFNRVKEELAARGVTKESVGENLEDFAKRILKNF